MRLHRMLVTLALISLFALGAWVGFTTHRLVVFIALAATPFLFLMTNKLPFWFVLTLGLRNSGLIFPGIPSGLHVVHIMMVGFILLIIAGAIIKRPPRLPATLSDRFLYLFLAVIVVTIFVRGFGIRALGGEAWGGMEYIKIFIGAGFLFASRHITLSEKDLKRAVILMLLLAFLPALAQLLFLFSRGRIYVQHHFIDASVGTLLSTMEAIESGGIARFQMLRGLSFNIFIATLAFIPFVGAKRLVVLALGALCFVLSGLSGFRIGILELAGSASMYVLLLARDRRVLRLSQYAMSGLVALLLLVPLAPHLPAPIQRSLSVIPFLDLSPAARAQAQSTSTWRIEIWKLAWSEVPRYLWIGKGFAFDPAELHAYGTRANSILGALAAHNYHSGPLTLLLDLGLFGFVFFSAFLAISARDALAMGRALRRQPNVPPFILRYYVLSLAVYLYSILTFYLIYGDVGRIVGSLVSLAVLQAIYRSTQAADGNPTPSGRAAHPTPRKGQVTSPAFGLYLSRRKTRSRSESRPQTLRRPPP